MRREVLHSKLHMAAVTTARPDYVGSITIEEDIGDEAMRACVLERFGAGLRFAQVEHMTTVEVSYPFVLEVQ